MKSGEVQLGDIKFDPATRAVTFKDGRPAKLRNKSKEVLRFLVNNPSRTVTKDEVMEAVWSDVTVSDEGLVQCIADIRRVIGKDARQIVETVPREGYRMHLRAEGQARQRTFLLPALFGAAALIVIGSIWLRPSEVVQPEASPEEVTAATSPPGTGSTEAYLEVLQGRVSANRFSSDESLIAERHFRRAIELDPNFARAYAELGTLFAVRFENDWTVLQGADRDKALFFAEKAVELDPDSWLGHYALGRLHSVFSDYKLAEEHLERAMNLQPDNEDARAYYGIVKNFQGDAKGAVAILEPSVKSHPHPPYWYYLGLGNALFNLGQLDAAEAALDTCLELSANSPYCLRYLIAVYGETGRVAEAQAASRAYADMGFEPSVGAIMDMMKFHHPDGRDRLESAYRAAGLPN